MRQLMTFFAIGCACVRLHAQGTILFNNHVPGLVDAGFYYADGLQGFGPGWTAQLFIAPTTPMTPLEPLFPTTTFKSGLEAAYVNPVVVTVPNAPPGSMVPIVMGAKFDANPAIFAQAGPTLVTVGGNGLEPGKLIGLTGISFTGIPEPSSVGLFVSGSLAVGLLASLRGRAFFRVSKPVRA